MRIALITDTYPPEINGVSTSCKSLCDILIKHGHQVLVITTNPFNNQITYEDGIIRIPGPALKKIYGYRIAGIINTKAMKYLRQFDPEIIHVQTDIGLGLFGRMAARSLDIPSVYTYHTMLEDYTYYVTKGHFDRLARHSVRSFARFMIGQCDEFITPSLKTKDYMRQIGIDFYANVIPTGVDFTKFDPKNIDPEITKSLKAKYGISESTFVVLSLGRLGKEKSIDLCINSFNTFIKENPHIDTKMVVVGKGPALEDLQLQADELGIADRVIFTGPCLPSEVQNYYSLGDAFVSASLTETQGLTYMEAMAAHLYVLARYDHNLLDVVKEGVTGYFFETEEEFSEKMLLVYEMYKNKDVKMLDSAISSIDQYSIETFYNSIIKVYKHALKRYW